MNTARKQTTRFALATSLCIIFAGCSTPRYLVPSGYSSTYQKALFEQAHSYELNAAVLEHANEETAILQ